MTNIEKLYNQFSECDERVQVAFLLCLIAASPSADVIKGSCVAEEVAAG